MGAAAKVAIVALRGIAAEGVILACCVEGAAA